MSGSLLLSNSNSGSLRAREQGSNATKAARDICALYGDGAIAERTARDWYATFKNGVFDLKDAPRSGRPVELDEERLNQLLHENSGQTTRELAEKTERSHTVVEKHLHSLGKVQKYVAWVPHALGIDNKIECATISNGDIPAAPWTHHKLYRVPTKRHEAYGCLRHLLRDYKARRPNLRIRSAPPPPHPPTLPPPWMSRWMSAPPPPHPPTLPPPWMSRWMSHPTKTPP
ncbi:hypothetical protein RB195_009797 [Necator americanus]|uniref:Mos1 transposase HTH domain-containing protein n=1 Tax=Necator americanus TaxID=51031 RepID=A0ABR1CUY6_NECAM